MENNSENKELRSFLERKKEPADDFEKEALEGFGLLDSEQEAIDLKAELDKEMEVRLSGTGRSAVRTYWMAAAALLLIAGLSAVFLLNSPEVQKKDLALNREQQRENVPGAPEKQELPAAAEEEKASPVSTSVRSETSKTTLQEPGVQGNTSARKKAMKPDVSQPKGEGNAAREQSISDDNINTQEKDAVTENASAKDETPAEVPPPAATGTLRNEDQSPNRSESKTKSALVTGSESKKTESARGRSRKKDNAGSAAPATPPSDNEAASDRISEEERNDRDKAEKESAAAGVLSQNTSGKGGKNSGPVKNEVTYKDGAAALHHTLKDLLMKENTDISFDAKLYINRKGLVEKAEFTEENRISRREKKKIEEVLLKLGGFSVSPGTQGLTVYLLQYRP